MTAPTIVQEKFSVLDTDARFHSISFDTAPADGNLVLIGYHVRGQTNPALVAVSTPSSGITEVAVAVQSAISRIERFTVTAAQENTYTTDAHVGGGANVAGSILWIMEISGQASGDPIDVTSVDVNASDVTAIAIGDLVTTFADCLLVAFAGVRVGGDDASFGGTNSFTFTDARDDESASGAQPSGGGYGVRTVTATATYNTTASWTDSGRATGIGVAVKGIIAGGVESSLVGGKLLNSLTRRRLAA